MSCTLMSPECHQIISTNNNNINRKSNIEEFLHRKLHFSVKEILR